MSENKYGYGFYTEEQLEDYYDELIGRLFNISSIFRITFLFLLQPSFSGDYAKTLEKETFTDAKKTTYLEAVKYVANLVWNGEIILTSLSIFYVPTFFIPQSTRSNRRPATLTSLAPWSTWTFSTPSSSASTPRAS